MSRDGMYSELSYRERRVLEARDLGVSHDDLAEKFDISEERVRQIESQAREKLARDHPKDRARSDEAPDFVSRVNAQIDNPGDPSWDAIRAADEARARATAPDQPKGEGR